MTPPAPVDLALSCQNKKSGTNQKQYLFAAHYKSLFWNVSTELMLKTAILISKNKCEDW